MGSVERRATTPSGGRTISWHRGDFPADGIHTSAPSSITCTIIGVRSHRLPTLCLGFPSPDASWRNASWQVSDARRTITSAACVSKKRNAYSHRQSGPRCMPLQKLVVLPARTECVWYLSATQGRPRPNFGPRYSVSDENQVPVRLSILTGRSYSDVRSKSIVCLSLRKKRTSGR
jgi:hypothetical protein